MSILSSLYHGEIHNKPNDVHNVSDAEHSGGGSARNGEGSSGSGASHNAYGGSGGGVSRNAYGGSGNGAGGTRQAANAGGWMGVSFADESTMDAQLADAHAVALSDAFDRTGTAPRRPRENTGGSAAPQHTQKSTDGSAVLPRHAERRMEALKEGDLRPPLYYTGQEQTPCANGVWESAHTVASKLESKEEFPQG